MNRIGLSILVLVILATLILPIAPTFAKTQLPNFDSQPRIIGYTIDNRPIYQQEFLGSTTYTDSSSDGFLWNSGVPYENIRLISTGNIANFMYSLVGQKYNGSVYEIYRSMLYFDTSLLSAGATITAADIKLYGSGDLSDTDKV